MSEDTTKKDEQKVKAARCEISKLFYDQPKELISCEVKLTGTIKSEDKWKIEDASTTVKLVKVPIRDLIVRVMVGWFWVRKIQDVLRKGSIGDARKALNAGYDWTEETTRGATKAAPAVVAERALGQINDLEELKRMQELVAAKMKELEQPKAQ